MRWGGQLTAGCPDSLMGVSALLEPGAEVRSGHPWRRRERRCLYVLTASWRQTVTRSGLQPRCPCSSCPPSFTMWPREDTLPLPCSAAAMSGYNMHQGRGDPRQQSIHTVPLPLASLAGSNPSCMTISVPPLPIYNFLLVFFSLCFFFKR